MKKKIIYVVFTIVAFMLFVPSIMATEIKVDTASKLLNAVTSAVDEDVIILEDDITLEEALVITKELTLNLNGNDLTFDANGTFVVQNEIAIRIEGGNLTITGSGKITEAEPWYAPIVIKGSKNKADTNYSTVTVDKDVTLEGYYGVLVRQGLKSDNYRAYGITVNFNGKFVSLKDSDDSYGSAIYVNGNIQPLSTEYDENGNIKEGALDNYPVINIGNTAVIESKGTGVYAAGYAAWNINGAKITAVDSGIAAKAGEFNITSTDITVTGEDLRPTDGYNDGVKPSGAVFQFESNKGYAREIKLNVESGNFVSEKGAVLYEYLNTGKKEDINDDTTETSLKELEINGGSFKSAEGKEVIAVTDKFIENTDASEFIKGGEFLSGDEEEFVKTLSGDYVLAEDAIEILITVIVDNEKKSEEKLVLEKGIIIDSEEFYQVVEDGIKDLYTLNGVYSDEDLTKEYNFDVALNDDANMYIDLTSIKAESGEETKEEEKTEEVSKENKTDNPDTGDINLTLLISIIISGMILLALVLKKRFVKNN